MTSSDVKQKFEPKIKAATFLVAIALSFVNVATSTALEEKSYVLGPEDRLMLKVWDVRNGDPYQWVALNGEFSIGADGNISLPLIGDVAAQGLTTSALSSLIGSQLKARIGLSTTPTASAQVIKYRSFFINGSVQRPGKYEYQPYLTVIQAISMAEGLYRSVDATRYQRELIGVAGDINVLASERIALLARQARLNAEISGQTRVSYPDDLLQKQKEAVVKLAIQQEDLLFEGRREAIKEQLATINQAKNILRSQLSSLEAKDSSISRQLYLTRKDLANVNDLAAKGMTIAQRQIGAEQTVASFESSKLDVQIATLKAQQDLSQTERDAVNIVTKFKTESLSEAAAVKAQLDVNFEKNRTAKSLLAEAKSYSSSSISAAETPSVNYSILRVGAEKFVPAEITTRVEPGDVLDVQLAKSRSRNLLSQSDATEN